MEAIPIVDLRVLSQAEINALSRASSSAAGDSHRCDDVVIPKIDRSVFNESAGSRKQTYSRLRLAPRKPPDLSSSASPSPSPSPSSGVPRGRRSSGGLPVAPSPASTSAAPHPPPAPSAAVDDPGRQENRQIVLFLRQLFAKNGIEIPNAAAAKDEQVGVPTASTCVDANPTPVGSGLGKRGREQAAPLAPNKDRGVLNINGMAVDLVGLGEKEDPFGPELKRRTQGLVKEDEFLGFLSVLEGQWGSRRRRRRIVDAGKFGDALPKGWKLLLGLKRKEGNVWLHCRRYISPSGKQFITCKEVSSYLLSFVGSQETRQQNVAQSSIDKVENEHAVGHSGQVNITSRSPSCSAATPMSAISTDCGKQDTLFRVENPAHAQVQDILKCQECNLSFADKGAHVQHLLTVHRSSRKRRRLGQSVGDGVIMRDGKYECQFCHKTFTERRRYNGHVGIHVKYHDRSFKLLTGETITGKNITSSDGAASAFGEHGNSVDSGERTKLIEKNMSTKSIHVLADVYPHGNEHVGDPVSDNSLKRYDNGTEKIMVDEICTTGAMGEMNNSFPLSSSYDNDKERNLLQEICTLPNDEVNEVSHLNNVLIENRKTEQNMKCSDSDRSSVQELFHAQCACKINDVSSLSNKQHNVDKVDCLPESNNKTSESRLVGHLANDCCMTDQKCKEAEEIGSIINGDAQTCLDYTSPSPSAVGNFPSEVSPGNEFSNNITIDEMERPSELKRAYERHSTDVLGCLQTSTEISISSESVIDGTENGESKICFDNNLNILPGMEQCDTTNAGDICMKGELAEMVNSGSEPENNLECVYPTSDSALTVENIVHAEIQPSGIMEKIYLEKTMVAPSGRKYCDIDTIIGNMLPSSGEEIMLDIMDQSGNKLNDGLMSDDTIINADALRNDTSIVDEQNMRSLPVNMQASWEQTSAHHPIIDMFSEQGNRRDSGQRPEGQMAYAGGLERGPGPCIQLGWDLVPPNLGPRRRISTVCVWCSAEFEHDDFDIEVHPDCVGFMCPTCKMKTSGQI